jgi:hypothetical protein
MTIINGRGRVGARPSSGGGGSSYDADALAFFTAASITDTTQMNAVNTLVTGLKSNNLWTKMKAIYPVVGGNATAHSKNLKNPSQYNLTFSSGWVHSSTGMLPNGTSSFARTGFSPNTIFQSKDDSGVSYYSRTNRTKDYGIPFGCNDSSSNAISFWSRLSSNQSVLKLNTNTFTTTVINSVTDSRGLWTLNRSSSTQQSAFRNGTNLVTANVTSTGLPTAELIIGANNPLTVIGSPSVNMEYYDNEEYSIFLFHDGLTSPQVSTLNTLVQAFQTTLSRNV